MSDEVTRRNILAIKQHADETRKQLRETQDLVNGYKNTLETLREEVKVLQTQLRALQIKMFTGGSTDGDNN